MTYRCLKCGDSLREDKSCKCGKSKFKYDNYKMFIKLEGEAVSQRDYEHLTMFNTTEKEIKQ
jgi:hypothetical protein